MKFGTDGIRGSAKDFITSEVAFNFGKAFAAHRKASERDITFAVARDTRTSGALLEAFLVAGMRSAGADVIITGIMPTAALSQFILEKKLDGGVMITASHNPPEDNGLKPLNHLGKKLSEEDRLGIESMFEYNIPENTISGISHEISCGWIPWMEKLWLFARGSSVANSLIGEKIVLDTANGAASHFASQALSIFGAKIIEIGLDDGEKININCGSLYPDRMVQLVRSSGAIAGIALDGDGDRIQICDSSGKLYDGDDILWMLRGNSQNIIGTIVSNLGLEKSLNNAGINLHRVPVGDSNVASAMSDLWSTIGGEPSGHILFSDGMPTSCGVFTAAKLLALNPKKWDRYLTGLKKTHQESKKVRIQDTSHISSMINEMQKNGAKIIIRQSGTEPVLRVMVEHEYLEIAKEFIEKLSNSLR